MNSLDYKKWISKQDYGCAICGRQSEPHHLTPIGMGRNRKKALKEHYTLIPLCRKHHSEIHQLGIKSFQGKYMMNLWKDVTNQLIKYLEELL